LHCQGAAQILLLLASGGPEGAAFWGQNSALFQPLPARGAESTLCCADASKRFFVFSSQRFKRHLLISQCCNEVVAQRREQPPRDR
jgi:hypothetical protein